MGEGEGEEGEEMKGRGKAVVGRRRTMGRCYEEEERGKVRRGREEGKKKES